MPFSEVGVVHEIF